MSLEYLVTLTVHFDKPPYVSAETVTHASFFPRGLDTRLDDWSPLGDDRLLPAATSSAAPARPAAAAASTAATVAASTPTCPAAAAVAASTDACPAATAAGASTSVAAPVHGWQKLPDRLPSA